MIYYSKYENLYFIENRIEDITIIQHLNKDFDGFFFNAQLKNLNDIKKEISKEIYQLNGNAIVNFKYGQKTVSFFKSIISRDDVCWYCSGDIVFLNKKQIEYIENNISKNNY